jgi:CarboxypepD_reg-like domain
VPLKTITYIILFAFFPLLSIAGDKEGKSENFAANKAISGTITDAFGESIPAVRIVVKETGEEFFANFEGRFNLTLPADKVYHLSLESMGFQPVELLSSELGHNAELSLKSL